MSVCLSVYPLFSCVSSSCHENKICVMCRSVMTFSLLKNPNDCFLCTVRCFSRILGTDLHARGRMTSFLSTTNQNVYSLFRFTLQLNHNKPCVQASSCRSQHPLLYHVAAVKLRNLSVIKLPYHRKTLSPLVYPLGCMTSC